MRKSTSDRPGGGTAIVCKLAGVLLALVAPGCSVLETTGLGTEPQELLQHPAALHELAPVPVEPVVQDPGRYMPDHTPPATAPPSELAKVSLPRYRIAPPDILTLQAVRLVPKPPYAIQTSDVVQIIVPGALPEQPIAGAFAVTGEGLVNLGPAYGSVRLAGLTVDEAQEAISRHLAQIGLESPQVSVSILQASGLQQIAGEHLVGPDGRINLGIYGSVYVAGMTVEEARKAIEQQLGAFLDAPKVSVEVLVYNSKFYYIVVEGAGFGDNIFRIPVTGNETVLDAIAQINGLQQISSKRIWISRPAPKELGCDQILPVDYEAITRGAATATNYQLMPGDRVFVAEDRLIAANSFITKVINPVERMFGFTLLGAQTIQFLQRFPRGSVAF